MSDIRDQIIAFHGANEIETEEQLEAYKANFNSTMVRVDEAHRNEDIQKRAVGKRLGSITNKLKPIAKAVGLEMTDKDLQATPVEEILDTLSNATSTRLEDLTKTARAGETKKLDEMRKELDQVIKDRDAYKHSSEELSGKLETTTNEMAGKLKSYKINHQLDQVKASIPWVDGITDVQRKGLDELIKESYDFDLDDNDNLIGRTKDGNLVPSKSKAGDFSTVAEIISEVASANRLVKANNAKSAESRTFTPSAGSGNGAQTGVDKLGPTYAKRIKQHSKG